MAFSRSEPNDTSSIPTGIHGRLQQCIKHSHQSMGAMLRYYGEKVYSRLTESSCYMNSHLSLSVAQAPHSIYCSSTLSGFTFTWPRFRLNLSTQPWASGVSRRASLWLTLYCSNDSATQHPCLPHYTSRLQPYLGLACSLICLLPAISDFLNTSIPKTTMHSPW